METSVNKGKRRKIIDIPENVFKILSIKAINSNTNLKAYIEMVLEDYAENLDDAQLYNHLVQTRPDGNVMLNKVEKKEFEDWLGI